MKRCVLSVVLLFLLPAPLLAREFVMRIGAGAMNYDSIKGPFVSGALQIELAGSFHVEAEASYWDTEGSTHFLRDAGLSGSGVWVIKSGAWRGILGAGAAVHFRRGTDGSVPVESKTRFGLQVFSGGEYYFSKRYGVFLMGRYDAVFRRDLPSELRRQDVLKFHTGLSVSF